jgi:hypothetical protein
LNGTFSLWRKDGVGNRYAVSASSTNAIWVDGYLIKLGEAQWTIEGDSSCRVYQTPEEAVRILLERDDQNDNSE